ncbi:hypothetical protein COU18_02585 [Candidatus Kaiserbacteria bacterium CG10_big_fil_rev_8_21_14_0_10_51_14]|uniref:EamA domain-containing protein n=1 Tax=Candidatus Kaiserbacteria bacterium CG10_big_fil_rev_8_21_14_0_10_51_14 TaxID=1974610 RepID=A0A2H0UAY1_9BACT|nr:MAG: hypothetical protein COU18_02585 [Candidatus Kaiserbacteria bacterium CG10_big_fil_rev_8_21_14_0_10_51_14]
MPWLVVALFAPALSAFGSYLDKYLLVHQKRTGGIGSVILFSCFFGVLILPVAFLLGGNIFSVTLLEAIILIANGCLTVATLAAYLYAIRDSNIVSVVPILQTIPVFGFVLGYFVLGETLGLYQIVGSVIIILCAILLSFEIEENIKVRFRKRDFFLALLSSFLFAVSGVVFKAIAIDRGYWVTQFWEYLGIGLIGVILFLLLASYRHSFLSVLRNRRIGVVGLNFSTEAVMVSSDLLLNFATLLAPIALVYSVNAFQPAFLVGYGLIGLLLAPRFMNQLAFVRRHIVIKILTIAIMIIGALIIYS